MSFIKPSNHEQKRTKKFKKQVGRIENLNYDEEEDSFTCANGRKLFLHREATELRNGQEVTTAVKAAWAASTGNNAARQRIRSSRRKLRCGRPSGKKSKLPEEH